MDDGGPAETEGVVDWRVAGRRDEGRMRIMRAAWGVDPRGVLGDEDG